MAIVLGTRGRSNIIWGPADVYIAEGGTLPVITAYGNTITKAAFDTLFANFLHIGETGKAPVISIKPFSRDLIKSTGVHWAAAKGWEVEADIPLYETDTAIENELITRAAANTDTDFMFAKGTAIGDHFFTIRAVPYLPELEKKNEWEEVETMRIKIKGKVVNLHDASGHYEII